MRYSGLPDVAPLMAATMPIAIRQRGGGDRRGMQLLQLGHVCHLAPSKLV